MGGDIEPQGTAGWIEQITKNGNVYSPDEYGVYLTKAIELDWRRQHPVSSRDAFPNLDLRIDEMIWQIQGEQTEDKEWTQI